VELYQSNCNDSGPTAGLQSPLAIYVSTGSVVGDGAMAVKRTRNASWTVSWTELVLAILISLALGVALGWILKSFLAPGKGGALTEKQKP
jgi:hypothetical protein